MEGKKAKLPPGSAGRLGNNPSGVQGVRRRGLIELREIVQGRKPRTQRVIAWKGSRAAAEKLTEKEGQEKDNAETPVGNAQGRQSAPMMGREERVQELLETERGPMALPQRLQRGEVRRPVVGRLLGGG